MILVLDQPIARAPIVAKRINSPQIDQVAGTMSLSIDDLDANGNAIGTTVVPIDPASAAAYVKTTEATLYQLAQVALKISGTLQNAAVAQAQVALGVKGP